MSPDSKPAIHIFGMGLAGLACAVKLVQKNVHKTHRIRLYEAAAKAGGRASSFYSKNLQKTVDNGTHLALSANKNLLGYLKTIGAKDRIVRTTPTSFPYLDLPTGNGWQVKPNIYNPACWFFAKHTRVPHVAVTQHVQDFIALAKANKSDTLADVIDTNSPLFKLFWQPLAESVLNEKPQTASAQLLKNVFTKATLTLGNGFTPLLAKENLDNCYITPAVSFLEQNGVELYFKQKIRQLELSGSTATKAVLTKQQFDIGKNDKVVLALPFAQTKRILPKITVPEGYGHIYNVHYLTSQPLTLPNNVKWLGLANAASHWIFSNGNITSVTISAAAHLENMDDAKLAQIVWQDICKARGRAGGFLPPYQVVRSKQATFAQIPANTSLRPDTTTRYDNILLAGDYTNTGLPCTMEGAVYSGYKAANKIL